MVAAESVARSRDGIKYSMSPAANSSAVANEGPGQTTAKPTMQGKARQDKTRSQEVPPFATYSADLPPARPSPLVQKCHRPVTCRKSVQVSKLLIRALKKLCCPIVRSSRLTLTRLPLIKRHLLQESSFRPRRLPLRNIHSHVPTYMECLYPCVFALPSLPIAARAPCPARGRPSAEMIGSHSSHTNTRTWQSEGSERTRFSPTTIVPPFPFLLPDVHSDEP